MRQSLELTTPDLVGKLKLEIIKMIFHGLHNNGINKLHVVPNLKFVCARLSAWLPQDLYGFIVK